MTLTQVAVPEQEQLGGMEIFAFVKSLYVSLIPQHSNYEHNIIYIALYLDIHNNNKTTNMKVVYSLFPE